jgi:hypothetical protein
MNDETNSRRQFLRQTSVAGLSLLLPTAVGCVHARRVPGPESATRDGLPLARPEHWDPVAFNLQRGRSGAIPADYLAKIEAPDGIAQHLGKHLPYVPAFAETPTRMLALMWGDPSLGYARHPNAPPAPNNPAGHWYNWIRIRGSSESTAEETESHFSGWPTTGVGDTGRYAALNDVALTDDEGRGTIYLVALPSSVRANDWVRVHGHCLTHGEYVDFVRVPS